MVAPKLESRRLASFQRSCRRSGPRSIDRYWAALSRHGFPLVERVRGDREKRLVTFVWRPGRKVTNPSVYTLVANFAENESAMRPLGVGGIWYCSFPLSRKTRASYGLSPRPFPSLTCSEEEWVRYIRSVRPDPLNPKQIRSDMLLSVFELPDAPRQTWARPRGPASWKEESHPFQSRRLGNTRTVTVYLPAGFAPTTVRYNLLVVFDGMAYRETVPAPRIVENLVAADRIRPTVLVLVDNAPGARFRDMLHNPAFPDFVARELLPWLRRRYRLSVPPSRMVLAGSSIGALASAQTAFRYPRLFGNVLAQSGAFQWEISGGKPGFTSLVQEYALAPKRPIRFYLDAGTHETMPIPECVVTLLGSVRHMRDVLEAKGYSVTYAEFEGAHDYACWRGTFADGLLHLLGRS